MKTKITSVKALFVSAALFVQFGLNAQQQIPVKIQQANFDNQKLLYKNSKSLPKTKITGKKFYNASKFTGSSLSKILMVPIFTEDFDSVAIPTIPSTWSNIANLPLGGVWQAGFSTADGTTLSSPTGANGFAFFDSDGYAGDGNAENADLITPMIDASTLPSVSLSFSHYFRAGFGGNAEVFVSNNGGTTYTSVASWFATSTPNAQSENIDISLIAAGNDSIMIKFHWTGDWSWYWLIDDIVVDINLANELVLNSIFSTSYSLIPLTQAFPITFEGRVANTGINSQPNVTLNANVTGAGTFSGNSTPLTLISGVDSLLTVATTYTPSVIGSYTVNFAVSSDSTDDNPSNDTLSENFDVSDTVFARDNGILPAGGIWLGAGNRYEYGNFFQVSNTQDVTSVTFSLHPASDSGATMKAKIYGLPGFTLIDSSAVYTVNAVTDVNAFTTLPLLNAPINLIAGDYLVVLATTNGAMNFVVSTGSDLFQPNGSTLMQDTDGALGPAGTWYLSLSTPFVRLNFAPPPPPACSANFSFFTDTTLTVSFIDSSTTSNPPLSRSWDFGDGGPVDITPSPAHTYGAAGSYYVCLTILDNVVCSNTICDSVTVPAPPPPGCTAGISSFTDVLCFGACDGSATVSASGGILPYTYSWAPTGGINPTAIGLCGGTTHTVTVTDAAGNSCTASQAITEPPDIVIISETPTDITACGANDGTITITAIGGTGTLSYSIDGGVIFPNTTGNFTGLSAGTYTVVVQDANGCIVTGSILTISEPGAPPAPAAGTNATYCQGDAMADLTATGSGGTLTWYDDAGLTNVVGTGATFSPPSTVGTITYYVTETVSGCQSPANSVVITVNPLPTVNLGSDTTICNGCSITLDAGAGFTSYGWSTGESTQIINVDSAGTYIVQVTDTNGCTAADTIIIDLDLPLCIITAGIAGTDASCVGNCDGEANLTVTNGTTPYTFNWSNGAVTEDLINLCADTYTVTVTDSNGCTASDSVTISSSNTLTAVITGVTPASCLAKCDGIASAFATGGTQPYTYLWNNPSAQTNSIANNLCAGTYIVTVTDAAGCPDTASVTVNSNPEMILNITITNATCGNTDGSASVVVSNGTPTYIYSWSSGDTLSFADSLASGFYIVTVTDAVGCSNFANVTISDANGPTITVVTSTDVTCNGGSDGVIGINVTDGTPPYTLQWSNGSSGDFIFNLPAGPYEINVTDANGCVATQSIAITEPDALSLTISTIDATCGNTDGSATVNVGGGTGAYTYQWGAGTGFQTTATATGLGAGVYNVTVTDASGCIDSAAVAVSNINGPLITVDSIIDISCDNPSGGSIYITVTGGYTPYTYLWSNNDITQDLLNIQGGIYDVTVTDTSGCVATASMEILGVLPTGDSICVVTVDSASGKNLIVWEKTTGANIKSYNIYKESTQAGVYFLIGAVPFNALSAFTDSLSNPVIRSWRYKIAAVDSCDNESELSKEHKTTHLTINMGINNTINLIWDHYQGFDFGTYYIHRYTTSTGWEEIDSMASNLTSWTDPLPPNEDLYYVVVVKHPTGCDPNLSKVLTYNSARSNVSNRLLPTGITEGGTSLRPVQVFPNPYSGVTQISYTLPEKADVLLEVFNVLGKKIQVLANGEQKSGAYQYSFSAKELGYSSGVYILKLIAGEDVYTKQLIEF